MIFFNATVVRQKRERSDGYLDFWFGGELSLRLTGISNWIRENFIYYTYMKRKSRIFITT